MIPSNLILNFNISSESGFSTRRFLAGDYTQLLWVWIRRFAKMNNCSELNQRPLQSPHHCKYLAGVVPNWSVAALAGHHIDHQLRTVGMACGRADGSPSDRRDHLFNRLLVPIKNRWLPSSPTPFSLRRRGAKTGKFPSKTSFSEVPLPGERDLG